MKKSPSWNLISILLTICIVVFFGFLAYFPYRPTRDIRERDMEFYNAETVGVVYCVTKKIGFWQGITGNKQTTLWYELKYYYEVNGKTYSNSDFVQGKTIAENRFLKFAVDSINTSSFAIRYASSNPSKSFLVKRID